jgi:NADH dehydrogenase (ubiquinone) flavoprotein 2
MLSRLTIFSLRHARPQSPAFLIRSYRSSRPLLASHAIVQHRETAVNKADAPWDFTPENYEKIKEILKKYPSNYKQSAVMPLLQIAQDQNDNWVPIAAMNKVAQLLDLPPIRVYEVATFYSQYNREPVGRYHIQLCGTTPCMLCGAEKIRSTIEKHLKIHAGETTEDKMFTLSEVECLGACVNAPMIQINNKEFYENLTPESTIKLLEDLRSGRKVHVGPQNGQKDCEGPQGQTSLKEPDKLDPQAAFRDLGKLKIELDKKAAQDKEAKDKEAKDKEAKDKAAAATSTPAKRGGEGGGSATAGPAAGGPGAVGATTGVPKSKTESGEGAAKPKKI